MQNVVTVYSRRDCHLCDVAIETLERLQQELDFAIEKRFIEGDSNLEAQYGDKVPVIHIDDEPHSIFRVDPERFKSSLDEHRQRQ